MDNPEWLRYLLEERKKKSKWSNCSTCTTVILPKIRKLSKSLPLIHPICRWMHTLANLIVFASNCTFVFVCLVAFRIFDKSFWLEFLVWQKANLFCIDWRAAMASVCFFFLIFFFVCLYHFLMLKVVFVKTTINYLIRCRALLTS